MSILIVSPIIVTLLAAILTLVLPQRISKIVGVIGSASLLAVAAGLLNFVLQNGIQVMQIGNWQ